MYQIKISYRTGGSYERNDETTLLDLEWSNLDVAKANLQRIKQHYDFMQDGRLLRNMEREEYLKSNQDNDWFVLEYFLVAIKDGDYQAIDKDRKKRYVNEGYCIENFIRDKAFDCIKLYTDDNKPYQISCFWIGYFETFYSAKIILKMDETIFVKGSY